MKCPTSPHSKWLGWLVCSLLLCLSAAPAPAKSAKELDIADTVAANRILTKLEALVIASQQGTFLSSRGPFTFFAPTNSAFSKLPPEVFAALLRPENQVRLQDILLFHIVNGKKLYAKDLMKATSLLSCEGAPLLVKTAKSGTQFVMKAKITHADIKCVNGIIHQIDTVLMPPESTLPPLILDAPAPQMDTNVAPLETNAPPAVQ
jgi:uncharacterized surface protein with fasciclin (FAS1) repeats